MPLTRRWLRSDGSGSRNAALATVLVVLAGFAYFAVLFAVAH